MADGSLFRRKAVEAKSDNRLGEIAISQPIGIWVLAGIAMAILTAAALFLIFGEYTRKTEVTGRLVPTAGLSTLTATGNGNVGRLFVKEGDTVKAGDPLVLIESDRNLADGRDANLALAASIDDKQRIVKAELREQNTLIRTQENGTSLQLAAMKKELTNLSEELKLRKNQAKLSEDTLHRFGRLLEQKFVSQIQVSQQEHAVLEQRANIESMERQRVAIQRNVVQLEQTLREIPARRKLAEAQAQREISNLNQERISGNINSSTLVKAKSDGLVTNKMVEVGLAVQSGQPILTVLPKSSTLQAHLLVPSRAVGLIQIGDDVILRYHAFPHQKFGHQKGRIIEVAKSALTHLEMNRLAGEAAERESHFRVIVELEEQSIFALGRHYALRPGLDVDAAVISETRSLMYWLFQSKHTHH